jgi:hypothetical protein
MINPGIAGFGVVEFARGPFEIRRSLRIAESGWFVYRKDALAFHSVRLNDGEEEPKQSHLRSWIAMESRSYYRRKPAEEIEQRQLWAPGVLDGIKPRDEAPHAAVFKLQQGGLTEEQIVVKLGVSEGTIKNRGREIKFLSSRVLSEGRLVAQTQLGNYLKRAKLSTVLLYRDRSLSRGDLPTRKNCRSRTSTTFGMTHAPQISESCEANRIGEGGFTTCPRGSARLLSGALMALVHIWRYLKSESGLRHDTNKNTSRPVSPTAFLNRDYSSARRIVSC